jgi:hypothetical protein
MWCEVAPDGRLIWTSSGDDLLAFRAADVRPANAAPAGPALRPVRRLRGAVPPGGVTGAAFYRGRLLLAGQQGRRFTVWSVSPATGARRLEIERQISGESEGLAVVDALGGILQWQVQPLTATPPPTYPRSTLLSFLPRLRPRVAVDPAFAPARRRTRFAVHVTAAVLGRVRPLAGATVTLAGVRRRTDARGRARLTVRLPHPGVWRVTARWRGDRGVARVRAGPPARAGGGRG